MAFCKQAHLLVYLTEQTNHRGFSRAGITGEDRMQFYSSRIREALFLADLFKIEVIDVLTDILLDLFHPDELIEFLQHILQRFFLLGGRASGAGSTSTKQEETLEDVLKKLDELIGMEEIKKNIREHINY